VNDKVYIHEFVDIIGHNRAKYMHHMTANWVPTAIAERNMQCFGVWGTVGSTGRWPEVVNMWELEGWDGLADNFAHELRGSGLQDPALVEWWAAAASLRRGGLDRILVPMPWSPTIDELIGSGVRGDVYAHELVRMPVGTVGRFLEAVEEVGRDALAALDAELVGAFRVAMRNDTEAVAIWALPGWSRWALYEQAWDGAALAAYKTRLVALGADIERTLLVDAPLAPLRIGRQPTADDRRPLSEIS
jgi:hypothetical protein